MPRAIPRLLVLSAALAACGSTDRTSDTAGSSTTLFPPNSTGFMTSTGTTGPSEGSGETTMLPGAESTGGFTEGEGGTTNIATTGVVDCTSLEAEFAAEAMAIRACAGDGECGQVLDGTSCGCTREWVARVDADPSHFYDLLQQGGDAGCNLVPDSTCDCPEAAGFACDGGICTWNYI